MDKSTNDQNKNVYAKCEVDEGGSNTQWNWYAEDKEENGGTPEPTEQPNCERKIRNWMSSLYTSRLVGWLYLCFTALRHILGHVGGGQLT